jgi:predicted component of type VI protein secretion system
VIYTAPSIFERLGAALLAEPIFLFGILGIVLALVGFLMFNASRQKSLSGTPVLQGRLGGKLRRSRKGPTPVIPVASDEPLALRSPVSSPAPAKKPASASPVNSPPPVPVPTVMASNPADSEAGNATVIAPSSKIPSATLTVLKGEGFTPSNKSAPVMPLPFVIGRSEGALIIVDSNISRRHAQITYDDMQHAYYLTDMNSSNGTQLNNHRLIPGQPVRLSGGSVIDLGPNVTLRFDLS